MDPLTLNHYKNLFIKDGQTKYQSFQWLSESAIEKVNWAYEAWDDLLLLSKNGDNHKRAIAVQLLSNVAKSDPQKRIVKDLAKLMEVTKDKMFVTARSSLQSLWKIGVLNKKTRDVLMEALTKRLSAC